MVKIFFSIGKNHNFIYKVQNYIFHMIHYQKMISVHFLNSTAQKCLLQKIIIDSSSNYIDPRTKSIHVGQTAHYKNHQKF